MRHRLRGRETRYIGNDCTRAESEKYAFAAKISRAAAVEQHFDGLWFRKSSLTHNQLNPAGFEFGEVHINEFLHHPPFSTSDRSHIHIDPPSRNAETRLGIDERNDFGTVNHILAGQTCHVNARAADH